MSFSYGEGGQAFMEISGREEHCDTARHRRGVLRMDSLPNALLGEADPASHSSGVSSFNLWPSLTWDVGGERVFLHQASLSPLAVACQSSWAPTTAFCERPKPETGLQPPPSQMPQLSSQNLRRSQFSLSGIVHITTPQKHTHTHTGLELIEEQRN